MNKTLGCLARCIVEQRISKQMQLSCNSSSESVSKKSDNKRDIVSYGLFMK